MKKNTISLRIDAIISQLRELSIDCEVKKPGPKKRKWFPTEISGQDMQRLCEWLNKWGNIDDIGNFDGNELYKKGYEEAIKDIFKLLKIDYLTQKEYNTKKKLEREQTMKENDV